MKAATLDQAIRYFDHQKALRGQELGLWYVERPYSPRRQLHGYLRAQRHNPVKALLIGHRGNGKSTELNKLLGEIDDAFEPIVIDIFEYLTTRTPRYEDLMLTLGTQIARQCIDRNLTGRPIGEPLQGAWSAMRNWWLDVISGLRIHEGGEIATYAELSTLLGQISVGAKRSSSSREEILDRLNRRMPDLITYINRIIDSANQELGERRLLVVVEGTDKVDMPAARHIFFEHAPTITALNTAMIYTFHLALYRSDEFNTIRSTFGTHRFLHNIAPFDQQGNPSPGGMQALRQIVLLRLEASLIDEDALTLIAQSSSGVAAHLIRLVQDAALHALARPAPAQKISLEDAQRSARDLRDDLLAPLKSADWQALAAVHQKNELTNDADMQRLLFTGALVEYTNDFPWCDVHVSLWSALQRYGGLQP